MKFGTEVDLEDYLHVTRKTLLTITNMAAVGNFEAVFCEFNI
jgi:hypothetical protein